MPTMKLYRLVSSNLRSFPVLSSSRVSPRVFPTTGFTTIPATDKVEEENWPWYKPESFYPVAIGDVIRSRYQVLYKLGYGTTSTVWMCRDLNHNTYVCLKSIRKNHPSIGREMKAYECTSQAAEKASSDKKNGFELGIRQTLDCFQLRAGSFDYHFLVQEPLGVSMLTLLQICERLPINLAHGFALTFLRTLAFVHKAKVTHADIHAGNIYSRIHDETILRDLEEDEIANPSPKKVTGHPTIFATKNIIHKGSLRRWYGLKSELVLCDFGEARTGKDYYRETIQPRAHRAPEVLMQIAFFVNADVWSFGCMLWHFVTGEVLFPSERDGQELEGADADAFQLATMNALLGPPSPRMLEIAAGGDPGSPMYFNEDGSPKCVVPQETLESRFASSVEHSECPMTPRQAEQFIAFIRRVLVWDLFDRPNSWTLLDYPWIKNNVDDVQ